MILPLTSRSWRREANNPSSGDDLAGVDDCALSFVRIYLWLPNLASQTSFKAVQFLEVYLK